MFYSIFDKTFIRDANKGSTYYNPTPDLLMLKLVKTVHILIIFNQLNVNDTNFTLLIRRPEIFTSPPRSPHGQELLLQLHSSHTKQN